MAQLGEHLPSTHIVGSNPTQGSSLWKFMYSVSVHFYWFPQQIPHGVDEQEAVRIFVEFTRIESAIKGAWADSCSLTVVSLTVLLTHLQLWWIWMADSLEDAQSELPFFLRIASANLILDQTPLKIHECIYNVHTCVFLIIHRIAQELLVSWSLVSFGKHI